MTYEEVELQLLAQVEHGLIYFDDEGYNCAQPCSQCPLGDVTQQWCAHDGIYRDALTSICKTKYPELFI